MTTVALKSSSGSAVTLESKVLDALRPKLRGSLALPGEAGYDEARTIWNAMIDRKPAAVVRAKSAADVALAVKLAREHGLLLAVRGGGHNIAGNAVCEGGLLLDLSQMKGMKIDQKQRTAHVEAGARLADFDAEAQAFGLATPVGVNSTTGVAGLTLGGGYGWLSRKYGLTIDNLISADVVLATGELVRASEKENPDLFWAIRGGGGNFGVVTSFEYRLHPVGPEVLAGLVVHPLKDAKQVLEGYRGLTAEAPDDATCWVVMRQAPPLPFLPADVHGTPILVLAMCYAGDPAKGQKALAPFRGLGTPIADVVGPMPYAGWQQAFDPLLVPGARNYWKSHDFLELSDAALEIMVSNIARVPAPDCEVFLTHMGGAINRVAANATAYPHRDVNYIMNAHTRWNDAAQDAACIAWARGLFDAVAPYATGGVYVNFMPEDEKARVKAGAYGPNYERLAKLKAKYDPENLFCMNHNIAPVA